MKRSDGQTTRWQDMARQRGEHLARCRAAMLRAATCTERFDLMCAEGNNDRDRLELDAWAAGRWGRAWEDAKEASRARLAAGLRQWIDANGRPQDVRQEETEEEDDEHERE